MNAPIDRSIFAAWRMPLVLLAIFLPAAAGVSGAFAQMAAFCFAAALGFALLTNAVIASAAHVLNRLARAHRESSKQNGEHGSVDDPYEQLVHKHRVELSQRQRIESHTKQVRQKNRCSQADALRAEALRLQAEIALIRREKCVHESP